MVSIILVLLFLYLSEISILISCDRFIIVEWILGFFNSSQMNSTPQA